MVDEASRGHFEDQGGAVQGPFSLAHMRAWHRLGYFPPSTRVRQGDDGAWSTVALEPEITENEITADEEGTAGVGLEPGLASSGSAPAADTGAALAPGLFGGAVDAAPVVVASSGLATALELPGDSEGAAPASLGAGFAEATLVAPMTGAASSDTAADGGGGDGQGEAAGVDGGEADGGEGEAAGVGEGGAAGVGEDGAADGS